MDIDKESYHDGITVTTVEYAEDWDQHKEINYNEIRTRLQHLESELATALHSLRSKKEDCISEEVCSLVSLFFTFLINFTCSGALV